MNKPRNGGSATNAPNHERIKPQPCIVLLHADGFVEVFANKNINVRIINRPKVHSTIAGRMADDLIWELLPRNYRNIYYPGMLQASGQLNTQDVGDVMFSLAETQAFYSIGSENSYRRYSTRKSILQAIMGA